MAGDPKQLPVTIFHVGKLVNTIGVFFANLRRWVKKFITLVFRLAMYHIGPPATGKDYSFAQGLNPSPRHNPKEHPQLSIPPYSYLIQ